MKRILINATQNEEIRVALCKGNHLYDFDLENRTREQKKSNIYKGHVTRVEPSLEAVFVEYGSQRQGFLPIREISTEYLSGNPRDENIKKLIKEGDELIVQVEKEERGNKGAALSTYVSLAGRYLVLMPNNPRGGGISRQISGKLREDMKRMLGGLDLPKGMSVIIRTAGIGKTQEDLQHDLNHLLNIWQAIQEQNQKYPSPRLVHQEAGVVTRAVRDYLRDDISEIWIDNENAYIEAAGFIDAVMPTQAEKLRKYTDYEPMFSRFNIEKQIETAYQREVRLPSGGSIVIDQTEALVSIDINSAKSTKGSDVAETAFHTNLEAADEIARQLRLRDMGGLIVIDFIDMNDNKNQKEVEKRLIDATKYDRARVQFGDISKFGLMEMSRQRLRPSLEESTGYICPRCHGNGMIRDLRSLSLSIMRQIEQIALKERQGEVQAEVPTDIAAFLLNEKRDSLVYLEQDSGTRITILPHAHLESPNFKLHFNRDGFAPSSYERITDTQQQEYSDLGYDVDWQTAEKERPEQQPTRQPRAASEHEQSHSAQNQQRSSNNQRNENNKAVSSVRAEQAPAQTPAKPQAVATAPAQTIAQVVATESPSVQPQAVAWLSNLFAQAPQAQTAHSVSSHDAAEAIEAIVNTGAQSLGSFGQVDNSALSNRQSSDAPASSAPQEARQTSRQSSDDDNKDDDKRKRKTRKTRSSKPRHRRERDETVRVDNEVENDNTSSADSTDKNQDKTSDNRSKREDSKHSSQRSANREEHRKDSERNANRNDTQTADAETRDSNEESNRSKRKPHSNRSSRGSLERGETLSADKQDKSSADKSSKVSNEVTLQVNETPVKLKSPEVVHLSLDDSKSKPSPEKEQDTKVNEVAGTSDTDKDQSTHVVDTETTEQPTTANAPSNSKGSESEHKQQESSPAPTNVSITDDSDNVKNSKSASDNTADEQVSSPALSYSHDSLFANHYVTASKFGQASNDPRVVRQQQSKVASGIATAASAASIPTPKSSAIQGSVGEFIRATLSDAESQLADNGVIASFIAAVTAYSNAASETREANNSETQSTGFDFSNYGYQPLSADYLKRFETMTQAVNQFGAEQGKTEVKPSVVTQRASNDPRGQHPDYVAASSEQDENKPETSGQQATLTLPEQVDEKTETLEQPDAHESEISTPASDTQMQDASTQSEHLSEVEAHSDDIDADADYENVQEDSQAGKSKTTIASYKNMIENVAEQLLQPTGMFNLTSHKVPKSRSRKPKTEHKKPTQAEKAHAEDASNTDDES